jgi:dienelactone hydrolase
MQLHTWPRRARKIMFTLLGIGGALGALWWALFALKPYDITPEQLAARYAHAPAAAASAPPAVELAAVRRITVGDTAAWASDLRMTSFDGAVATGRIVYPTDPSNPANSAEQATPRPVLLGLHAMGRTQLRWFEAELRSRPTIENTHRLAELALRQGYVVVALDAREHGDRKNPDKPLIAREMLRNMHWWGEREPYERLIVNSVKDWRVLLDWLTQQPQFDRADIRAAGYSMGAQMALLLAATDGRVSAVAAMVPPGLTNRVAVVAPLNVAPRLSGTRVWLLTADDDEHASIKENAALFEALPGAGKQHLRFAGGHLLPAHYVQRLVPWLGADGGGAKAAP